MLGQNKGQSDQTDPLQSAVLSDFVRAIRRKKMRTMAKTERRFQIESRRQWRKWLEKHHDRHDGIWLVTFKKHCGAKRIEETARLAQDNIRAINGVSDWMLS